MLTLVLAAQAATFDLDPKASALYVLVRKDPATLASRLAHDHVVVATSWSGRATLDDDACHVDVRVDVASLEPDEPAWRRRAGLDKEVTEGQRQDIRESMLAEDQLDAQRFPAIEFSSSRCEASPEGLVVTGELTLRGVSRTVSFPLSIETGEGLLRATGSFDIRATDHGFEPYSAFFGAVKNLDRMTVVVDVVGRVERPA